MAPYLNRLSHEIKVKIQRMEREMPFAEKLQINEAPLFCLVIFGRKKRAKEIISFC